MKRLTTVPLLAFVAAVVIATPAHAGAPVVDTEAPPPFFDCPQPHGLFLHDDPGKFWHCSNGFPYEQQCPANLHFNDRLKQCDWPVNARNPNAFGAD